MDFHTVLRGGSLPCFPLKISFCNDEISTFITQIGQWDHVFFNAYRPSYTYGKPV